MKIRIRLQRSRTNETLRTRQIHPLRLSRWIAEGLLVVLGLDLADDFLVRAAEPDPTYTLTVAVFNDARVPPTVLARAQETASYIFAKSGIDIRWMLCGREDENPEERSACSQPEFPEHLDVHIVSGCPRLPTSVFGISYISPEGIGSQADVFYARIAAFRQNPAELSTLLGYAMAHELGHLLLGTNSHSPAGLMRADWRTKDLTSMGQGGLGFSEEQAQTMKAKLSTFALRKESFIGRASAGR